MHFERYRDYARKGFFELLVVTVLSMGLILSLRWITSKRTVRQAYAINALCSLTIALSLVMLASALQRLVVWESVQYYINTPTRLYVRTFIAWLGVPTCGCWSPSGCARTASPWGASSAPWGSWSR